MNTVARLMAEFGLAGRKVRHRCGPTRPGKRPTAPDFVRRDFTADAPDQVWCGDMTEITTGRGQALPGHRHRPVLASVARLCDGRPSRRRSRRRLSEHGHGTRGGDVRGVIFHSDRGSEYVSRRFRRFCRRLGVTRFTGRVGSCFNVNAVSEVFNSVLKLEYVRRHTFATPTEARLRIATWITGFYNNRRLHSVYGYHSPIDYQRDHQADPTVEPAA